MPRFYFDVLNGREVHQDPEGQEFADRDAALADAAASAQYLVAHGILRSEDVSGWSFLIRTENEQIIATVPFRSTLPGTLHGSPLPAPDQPVTLGSSLERLVEGHNWAHEDERHLRDLIEALPAAIYTTDAEGWVTFYNQAAVALAGRRPEVGRDRWCVTWRKYRLDGTPVPHDRCPMAIALHQNRPIRGAEGVVERPDGTRISILPYPTPLHDASGTLVGGVNLLLETTPLKRSQSWIGSQQSRLR